MFYAYTFSFSVDVGNIIPSFGEVLNEVNRHMTDFGFNEGRLTARNEALTTTVEPLPLLSDGDLKDLTDLLLRDLQKYKPEWDVRLENITCREIGAPDNFQSRKVEVPK